nr:envelope glycoprotein [synthetic construct]
MKVMKKKKEKSWILVIVMAFIIPCSSSRPLYATVYYGVPVWRDAQTTLFCAADAKMASSEMHNVWATQACVPTDPQPIELKLTNVTETFNIWKSGMVEQMQEDIISLWDQSLKPCVKLTVMCVTMNCSRFTPNTTTHSLNMTGPAPRTSNPTTSSHNMTSTPNIPELEVYNCTFNVTTVLKDKKSQQQALFYREDLSQIGDENSTYRLINCNTSTISQACPKVSFEPLPIQYCAPAGYALMKCNQSKFNGTGTCNETLITHCTHGIRPTVSTQFIFNGTLEKELLMLSKNISDSGKTIIVKLKKAVTFKCERTGNNTRGQIQIGPMTIYNSENIVGKTRKAYCAYNRTEWEQALKTISEAFAKLENVTKVQWKNSSGGDLEVAMLHFNCHGEFFYCNTTTMFNYTYNCSHHSCKAQSKNISEGSGDSYIPCKLKQVVNSWMRVGSGLFAPPIRGTLKCMSNITGLLLERDVPLNITATNRNITLRPTGGEMKDIWRSELYPYKVVQVKALSVAPTKIKRPIIGLNREKRGAGLGMLFLGFMSAAGSTMGAASLTLTVQAKQLLHGIVQQQNNMLRAIAAQQELLRLSVWGIRQLRARLLAIETYLRDQQLLGLWGCAGKLICYTNVPWNNTWTNKSDTELEHIWENLTWQEWDKLVDNYTDDIFLKIQEANTQQEVNEKKLLELDKWADLWSWFDITKWLWYIKIAIMIVGALIGLRVVMVVLSLVKNIRKGYQPLSLQTPSPHPTEPGTPEKTGGEGGEGDKHKWTPLPPGFLHLLYLDLRTIILWSYHLLSSLVSRIQRILSLLGLGLRILGQKTFEACKTLKATAQYWLQELQRSATNLLDTVAVAVANWTDSIILGVQRFGRGILNIPRRIRQGLELSLL